MPVNVLSDAATSHPWFSQFSARLSDHRSFRVVDNRLFDLVAESPAHVTPLAYETDEQRVLTMVELARDRESGMPRIFGANHHPEIIDREHILAVLQEKRDHGEVSDKWYQERAHTLTTLFQGEQERQSRLTSEYTLLGLLRHHVARLA